MTDSMLISAVYIFGFLMLFLLGMVIMLPAGKWIGHRLDSWPDRPMTNQEKLAKWSLKYHQATPNTPNRWPWKWIEKHGTGIIPITLSDFKTTFKGWHEFKIGSWDIPETTEGNDNE